MVSRIEGVKDTQTVTPDGRSVMPLIDGVEVRYAVTIPDERGTVVEIMSAGWEFTREPIVYVYQVTIRPGKIKGWIMHKTYDDRLFISLGTVKWVLYDAREGSPTAGMLNEIYLGQDNRGLLRIPSGIYHAAENVGNVDALFVNMPTRPYDHLNPDKWRLPLDTDAIPYKFEARQGW